MKLCAQLKGENHLFCKVHLAKFTFLKDFSQKICIYQKKAVPLHQNLKPNQKVFNILTIRYNSQITTKCITTKIMPIMKTLTKFENSCCTIKLLIQTTKECVTNLNEKLYKVVITPKHTNTWMEYKKEFTYSKDAHKYILEQIEYWLV